MKLQNGEQVVKEQAGVVWAKGKLANFRGKLVLTNQRLIFERQSLLASQLGLLGVLLASVLPGKVVVSQPLGELSSVSRAKAGLAKNVVAIRTTTSQEYKIAGPKFEDWAPVLAQAGILEAAPAPSA